METIIGAIIGAIITGGIGLWQIFLTRKSLEDANRPYISIRNEVLYIEQPVEYIVIKNSGNVPAKIENIIYDQSQLSNMNVKISGSEKTIYPNNVISYFKGSHLAPNQSCWIPINNANTKFENIKITIIYKSFTSKKSYNETTILNLKENIDRTFIKFDGIPNRIALLGQ